MDWLLKMLLLAIGLVTVLRLCMAWLNTAAHLQLPTHEPTEHSELVSILVPARNEAHQIAYLVANLQQLQGVVWELIIYDDDSTDATYAQAKAAIAGEEQCQLIAGKGLPEGWFGKNHACYQLSQAAQGRFLLFLDADVRLQKHAVAAALAILKQKKAGLLSVFPKQIMPSFGEQLIVPFMHHILLSWLPLYTVYSCKSARFTATNGQFMLFEASSYHANAWHKQLKSELVEDVGIMRSMKLNGEKGITLLAASGQVSCRMYSDLPSAVQGFSKNIVKGFGSVWGVFLYSLLTFWLWIPLFLSFPKETFLLFLCLLIGRVMSSMAAGDQVIRNIGLHFLQQLSWQFLLMNAVKQYLRKQLKWKDRIVS